VIGRPCVLLGFRDSLVTFIACSQSVLERVENARNVIDEL
jgi:hypothetical protein